LDNAGKTTICKKLCGQSIDHIEPTLGFHIHTLEHLNYKLNLWDIGGQRTIRAYWRNYFEQTDGLIWVVDSCDEARLQVCQHEMQQVLQQERLAGATLLVFANKQDLLVVQSQSSSSLASSSSSSQPHNNHDNNTNSDHDEMGCGDGGVPQNNKDDATLLETASTSTTTLAAATTTTTTAAAALSCDEISQALELNDQNIRHDQRHWSIQPCSAVTGQGLVEGIDWLVEDISNRIFLLS
jgi:small GTP-binding protein